MSDIDIVYISCTATSSLASSCQGSSPASNSRGQINILLVRRRTVPVRAAVAEQQRRRHGNRPVSAATGPADVEPGRGRRPALHHVVLSVRVLAAHHHAVPWRRDVRQVGRVPVRRVRLPGSDVTITIMEVLADRSGTDRRRPNGGAPRERVFGRRGRALESYVPRRTADGAAGTRLHLLRHRHQRNVGPRGDCAQRDGLGRRCVCSWSLTAILHTAFYVRLFNSFPL